MRTVFGSLASRSHGSICEPCVVGGQLPLQPLVGLHLGGCVERKQEEEEGVVGEPSANRDTCQCLEGLVVSLR